MDEASSVAAVVAEEEEVVALVVEVEVVPSNEKVCRAMCRPGSLVRDTVATSAALQVMNVCTFCSNMI